MSSSTESGMSRFHTNIRCSFAVHSVFIFLSRSDSGTPSLLQISIRSRMRPIFRYRELILKCSSRRFSEGWTFDCEGERFIG
jgi:hypothetical protein